MRTKGELSNGNSPEPGPSYSFLTEHQRAALDAALAAKQTAPIAVPSGARLSPTASREITRSNSLGLRGSPSKGLKSAGSSDLHDHHRSQQSRKGHGKTKKGGAGGKWTWGISSCHDDNSEGGELDRGDPNYDSGEEQQALAFHSRKVEMVKAYKQAVQAVLEEFYVNGDVQDVATTLEELGAPEFHHFFVKKVITLSMDKNDREHEMASNLLSNLYHGVVQAAQMQKGFRNLLHSVDDLKLDVPSAEDDVALFLARAVVDDVLPPAFLQKVPCAQGSVAAAVKAKAELHLKARRPAERLLRVWGGTDRVTLDHTKDCISKCLQEYLGSKDVQESRHCLHKLAVPFFHHELVKQALLLVLEDRSKEGSLVELLKQLNASGDVSDSQVSRGFQRVSNNLEDTCLDLPQAKDRFQTLVSQARAGGWLDADWDTANEGTLSSLPNSPTAGAPSSEAVQYKATAVAAMREYLSSSEAAEVASTLQELQQPHLAYIFVKQAVQTAMDRKDRERELASGLLSYLCPNTISGEQMAKGFTRLLQFAEDLQLDNPDAAHLLALFLGRAIVDEILPPSFLAAVLPSLEDHSEGVNVVQSTGAILSARHAAERLQNCWHGGSQTIDQLRTSMQDLLAEYLTNGDAVEASRCLMELNVPYYHHEVVKRALVLAADDKKEHHAQLLLKLLAQLSASGAINQTQMRKGFERVQDGLDDLALDSPHVKTSFEGFRQQAVQEKWLA